MAALAGYRERAVKRWPRWVRFRRSRVLTLVLLPFFFTTLELPARLLLLLWFAVQLISGLAAPDGGASVAFRAHIGGFLTGMLLVPFLKRREVPLW